MLFHFSFYWNKHPSVPAAGHELAVEPGLHHLSRVKFPKIAFAGAVQSSKTTADNYNVFLCGRFLSGGVTHGSPL